LIPRFVHSAMTSALFDIRSMQSTTQSYFVSSSRAAVSWVKYSLMHVTRQAGLMNFTRSASAATFGRPMLPSSAGSWRLTLVTHTSSRSIIVIAPMPDRASPSTTHDPTPPTPTTHTCAACRRGRAAAP